LIYRVSDICLSAIECHLFALFKGFLTGVREVALVGDEGEEIEGKLPPSIKKALISKQTLGHFNKLDLTDAFEYTFNLFTLSTAMFPIF